MRGHRCIWSEILPHTLSTPSQDLRSPDILYRSLGCKLAVGMPFKDIATADSLLLREVPPADDGPARQALRRMAVRAGIEDHLATPLQQAPADVTEDHWGCSHATDNCCLASRQAAMNRACTDQS